MENKLKMVVLIPAYNEEKNIFDVVTQVKKYIPLVIVVDDGSSDQTAQKARKAGADVLVHEVNKGKGAAIRTGFDEVLKQHMDAVIIMDADGQHDASELPGIIEKARIDQADIVMANRMDNPEGMPFLRYATNKFTSFIISKVAKVQIKDTQCGFRLIRTWLLPKMRLTTTLYDTESEMLLEASRLGATFSNAPIKSIYEGSESNIKKTRDAIRFFKLIFKYMKKPKITDEKTKAL